MMTAFYMGRQVWLVFFGESRTHLKPVEEHHGDHGHDAHGHDAHGHDDHGHDDHGAHHGVHEVGWIMRAPLVILATLSTFFVFSTDPLDGAKGWFMHLVPTPSTVVRSAEAPKEASLAITGGKMLAEASTDSEHATGAAVAVAAESHGPVFSDPRQAELAHAMHANHYTAIYLSSGMLVLGIGFALVVYAFGFIDPEKTAQAIHPLYLYSFNKWYWDEIYDATVIKGSMLIAKMLAWFDTNIVDGIVNGIATIFRKFAFANANFDKYVVDGAVNFTAFFVQTTGAVMRKIQTGKVQTYLVMVTMAVLGYFAFYLVQLMK